MAPKPETLQRELGLLALVPAGAETSGRRARRVEGTPAELALAREVLEYLNAVSSSRFQPTTKNLGFILDRMAEGYTPHVLKLVAFHRRVTWRQDPKMLEYLRPATIYNGEKCNQYAGQVPAVYFKTCACGAELLPDKPKCPNGCEPAEVIAEREARQPMPEHVRRREGESVKQWIDRLKKAGKAAA